MTSRETLWLKVRGRHDLLGFLLDLWMEQEVTGEPVTLSMRQRGMEWRMSARKVAAMLKELEELGLAETTGHGSYGQPVVAVRLPSGEKQSATKPEPKQEPYSGRTTYDGAFEGLWKVHPKGSKKAAYAAWKQQVKDGKEPAYIHTMLEKLVAWYESKGTEPQYRKNLSTWLNPDEEHVERVPEPEPEARDPWEEMQNKLR